MAGKLPRLYVQLGWRTAVAVLAAFGAAQWFTHGMPDKYNARALLLLSPLPFEFTDDVPGAVSTQDIDSRRVSYVKVTNIAPLAMPDYKLLLTSEDTAARLVERVKPVYEKKGLSTAGLSAASIMGSLDLRHKTLLTSSVEVKYQQIAELVVTAGDPDVAAGLANAWAELAVEVAQEVRNTSGQGAVAVLQAQIAEVQQRIDASAKSLAALEIQTEVDNRAAMNALDRELALDTTIAKELKTSLNAAQLVTRNTTPEFKIVSRAIPPGGPSGPDRSLYVLVAVFLAAIGAPALFFTASALGRYARLYEEQQGKP
jgi:capsular polysaccharide biosynthesis protein